MLPVLFIRVTIFVRACPLVGRVRKPSDECGIAWALETEISLAEEARPMRLGRRSSYVNCARQSDTCC